MLFAFSFTAMSNIMHNDSLCIVINAVDDAIFPNMNPVLIFSTLPFTGLAGQWIVLQAINLGRNAFHQKSGKRTPIFLDRRLEYNSIGCHLFANGVSFPAKKPVFRCAVRL